MTTLLERRCGKDVVISRSERNVLGGPCEKVDVRKTLWERRCEKDVVRKTFREKNIVGKTL